MKNLLWITPLIIFIILMPLSVILTSYNLYQDNQKELNKLSEEHRPILTVDGVFATDKTTAVDKEHQTTKFTLALNFSNLGDRAAYQTKIISFSSPLAQLDKISRYPDLYIANPIYAGTKSFAELDYTGYYTPQGNYGVVLIYINLQYSNQPQNGTWHQDEYWLAPTMDFSINKYTMRSLDLQWVNIYKPYIDKQLGK